MWNEFRMLECILTRVCIDTADFGLCVLQRSTPDEEFVL